MSTETSSISFTLEASGQPINIPNGTFQQTGNITVSYTIAGGPTSMELFVEGINSPETANTDYGHQPGTPTLLDSYVGTSNTTRTIALSALYDSFRVTAIYSGGTNVTVSGNLAASGAGAVFSSANIPSIQTWTA
jgi:hypothetical protein